MKRPWGFLFASFLFSCSSPGRVEPSDGGSVTDSTVKSDGQSLPDAKADRGIPIDTDAKPPTGAFCSLPGSIVFTATGPEIIPGGDASAPSLGWLTLPQGFCAHYYGQVSMARQLRFAPDGRLFIASPCCGTTGGGNNGTSSIVILPDADHDGLADSSMPYLTGLPKTQGLLFAGGYLYFQGDPMGQGSNGLSVMRVPFQNGDVAPSGSVETVTTITAP